MQSRVPFNEFCTFHSQKCGEKRVFQKTIYIHMVHRSPPTPPWYQIIFQNFECKWYSGRPCISGAFTISHLVTLLVAQAAIAATRLEPQPRQPSAAEIFCVVRHINILPFFGIPSFQICKFSVIVSLFWASWAGQGKPTTFCCIANRTMRKLAADQRYLLTEKMNTTTNVCSPSSPKGKRKQRASQAGLPSLIPPSSFSREKEDLLSFKGRRSPGQPL